MAIKAYVKTALTGGGSSALDGIDGDNLNDGDIAFTNVSGTSYHHKLNATSGASESSPDVIVPDTNPGTKAWELQAAYGSGVDTSGTPATNDYARFTDADTIEGREYSEVKADLGLDYNTIYVDAGAMVGCTTNGAESGTNEYATNDVEFDYFAFDGGATEERVQFKLVMPEDWDRGTIKAKFLWSSATGSTTADTVQWGIKAGAISDDDAIDTALGTAQVISDALTADNGNDLQTSSATSAITVAGSPALHDLVAFEVYRDTDGTDDMAEDAWLFGVLIQYKKSETVSVW